MNDRVCTSTFFNNLFDTALLTEWYNTRMINLIDPPPQLKEGDLAPDFRLQGEDGNIYHLYEQLQKGWVVLFFYPKDETPGCTAQACAFRNTHQTFKEHGAQILGISADSETSHQRFQQKEQLSYPLLSDPGGETARAFGVKKTLGLLPGRVTFVIDPDRTIRLAYASQFNPASHAQKALAVIQAHIQSP